ncbi:hypothetical protein LguiB_025986 [Lonicera macranthoides]
MAESVPPNPDFVVPPSTPPSAPPDPPSPLQSLLQRRPAVRVTSEFDSETSVFFHKISCKFFESLAKLKVSFQNNSKGEIYDPQVAFTSKYLSLLYDVEEQNAVVKSTVEVTPGLQLRAIHDVKAQQGEVAMVADLASPAYKVELLSALPADGLPKATLKFPLGEVSFEKKVEVEEEEVQRMLSISGIVKGQFFNGACTAQYNDGNVNLRYSYKDEEMTIIPSISLPSNVLSLAFKRRFGPSDKLSYLYNFDSNDWSAVYKHTVGKDYKLKAGYDSQVRLGWASLWVGDEAGRAKTAPMKTKVQFMLQVPQDDIGSSALMFRVKKRWDI